jgi:hypothetical protein
MMMMMMDFRLQKNKNMLFNLYLRTDISSIYERNKLGCILLLWPRVAQIFQKLYVQAQRSTRQESGINQIPYTANPGILGATQQNLVIQE